MRDDIIKIVRANRNITSDQLDRKLRHLASYRADGYAPVLIGLIKEGILAWTEPKNPHNNQIYHVYVHRPVYSNYKGSL